MNRTAVAVPNTYFVSFNGSPQSQMCTYIYIYILYTMRSVCVAFMTCSAHTPGQLTRPGMCPAH